MSIMTMIVRMVIVAATRDATCVTALDDGRLVAA